MHRGLSWLLGATIFASLVAIYSGNPSRLVAAVEPRVRQSEPFYPMLGPSNPGAFARALPLPGDLIPLAIEAAKRDIFLPLPTIPAAASQPKPVLPSVVVVTVPPPAPPAVPQAPPANARFLGSIVTPEGKKVVYLIRGDSAVPVVNGQRLDDGYIVESLTALAITLIYPPSGLRVVVPIPPPHER